MTTGLPIIPPHHLPTSPDEVVIIADWTARRDYFGRLPFIVWWLPGRAWCPDHPAGQVFFANPEEHAAAWETGSVGTGEPRSVRVEQEMT